MTNELIFFTVLFLDFTLILVVSRLDRAYLFTTIILNILLIAVFGAKLVSLFGFTTNVGNVFYASAFFATQILVELYGKKEAYKIIWLGAVSVIFFMLMAQSVIFTVGLSQTRLVNDAIEVLFQAAPRIAVASFIAYVLSQVINISLFSFLSKKTQGKFLYLRINFSNIAGQLIDSILFFTIAFYGTVSAPILIQTMLVGYILKVIAGFLSTPFFYLTDGKTR